MTTITYYFSTMSAFTYLAGTRAEQIAAEHGARLEYRPLDPLALFARTGGQAPGQRHPNRQAYRTQELRRQAAQAGLPIVLKPAFFPANPAPSSYAVIAAARAGGGDLGVLVHALTRAVWADERDIADENVIRVCLAEAGFDPDLANQDLMRSAETYAANLEQAVAAGVFGVPFYITEDDERFWGQDRLADLAAHLAR